MNGVYLFYSRILMGFSLVLVLVGFGGDRLTRFNVALWLGVCLTGCDRVSVSCCVWVVWIKGGCMRKLSDGCLTMILCINVHLAVSACGISVCLWYEMVCEFDNWMLVACKMLYIFKCLVFVDILMSSLILLWRVVELQFACIVLSAIRYLMPVCCCVVNVWLLHYRFAESSGLVSLIKLLLDSWLLLVLQIFGILCCGTVIVNVIYIYETVIAHESIFVSADMFDLGVMYRERCVDRLLHMIFSCVQLFSVTCICMLGRVCEFLEFR
eukprot:gene2638-1636_t